MHTIEYYKTSLLLKHVLSIKKKLENNPSLSRLVENNWFISWGAFFLHGLSPVSLLQSTDSILSPSECTRLSATYTCPSTNTLGRRSMTT